MQLSENTLNILKNFASINQGIVVSPGNKIRTINTFRTILADAEVDETFPTAFKLYDLNKVLSAIDKNTKEIVFERDHLSINSIGNIRIRYSDGVGITAPPDKSIVMKDTIATAKISAETVRWIFTCASILKCPNIVIKCAGEDQPITIWAMDVDGAIVDDAYTEIPGESTAAFEIVILMQNLNIIQGGYDVKISQGVLEFKHTTHKVTYWITTEKKKGKKHG